MSSLPLHIPGLPETQLATELERFSFGLAVSEYANVEPINGPDACVATLVRFGGFMISHAHHPTTGDQRVMVRGDSVPEIVNELAFMFDTHARLVMSWVPGHAGPMLVTGRVATDLSQTIKTVNDDFETS